MSSFDTCFFERYAHETLRRCLGHGYDDLVNRDRPDLQSPDGESVGIEVTRAMEESKAAADQMLDNMSGLYYGPDITVQESRYWSLALPMKRILESKLSKLNCGLYGDFLHNDLFVFTKDGLSEADVIGASRRMFDLQAFCDRRFDLLFLCEINTLHVCNLSEYISNDYRISSYPISLDLRKEIYYASL